MSGPDVEHRRAQAKPRPGASTQSLATAYLREKRTTGGWRSSAMVPTPEELRAAAEAAIGRGDFRPTEWETAFHEAGHVVVEVAAAGSYPDEVYLNDHDQRGADHAGRTVGRSFAAVVDMCVSDLDEHEAALVDAERRRLAAVLAAGELAADIARGFRLDLGDKVGTVLDDDTVEGADAEQLHALVDGMTEGQAETWLEGVFGEAERLLRERWVDVERLAAALVERRHLDRDDLWTLLPHAGPVGPQ